MIRLRTWDIYVTQGEIITGGHGEFSRGEVITFAPRCTWDEMTRTNQREKSIVRSRRRRPYHVVAEVLQVTNRVLVIDFGIPAFARAFLVPDELRRGDLSPGKFITGDLTVLIDSPEVAYVHDDVADFGALYRRWQILGISKCIAPLRPVFDQHGVQQYLIADYGHATYESVERTVGPFDTWMTNEQSTVDYRLRCRLLKA